jgi:hypothetical protein
MHGAAKRGHGDCGMRKRGDFDFFTLLMIAVPIGLALWALVVLWLMFG